MVTKSIQSTGQRPNPAVSESVLCRVFREFLTICWRQVIAARATGRVVQRYSQTLLFLILNFRGSAVNSYDDISRTGILC